VVIALVCPAAKQQDAAQAGHESGRREPKSSNKDGFGHRDTRNWKRKLALDRSCH